MLCSKQLSCIEARGAKQGVEQNANRYFQSTAQTYPDILNERILQLGRRAEAPFARLIRIREIAAQNKNSPRFAALIKSGGTVGVTCPYPDGPPDVWQPGADELRDLGAVEAVVLGQRHDEELLVASAAASPGSDPGAGEAYAGEGQLPAAARRVLEAHGGARVATSGFGRVQINIPGEGGGRKR